jgi:CRISPR-associated endonuclease/helicase Cas3
MINEKIIKNPDLFARKKIDFENNIEFQTLNEHLSDVANLAYNYAKGINAEKIAMLAGLLHDLGKATVAFQKYLQEGGERGSVIHALQGAILSCIRDLKKEDMPLREVLALIISGHHNGINDGCSVDGTEIFLEKLKRKDKLELCYGEVLDNIKIDIIDSLFEQANTQMLNIIKTISQSYNNRQSAYFALGLFVKYIFSCLIDADRLDAYMFDVDNEYKETAPDWTCLKNVFEENIIKKQNDSVISDIRKDISQKCKEAAKKESGIYQLSVPTGGGKTLSSLRFALHHCIEYNKKRIIYVIPYLSIIEQTSKSICSILNLSEKNEILLEDHSNIIISDDDEKSEIRKLAASRWNNPIIITTMVQFLETLMSSRASRLRKFHNMSDAVIIFDEIQSLPIKCIHLFNESISFLSKICNSTILLCTATQPLLAKTERNNLLLSSKPDLIENVDNYFKELNRTKIIYENEKNIEELSDFIFRKAESNGNCLAILNTKKEAKEIYLNLVKKNTKKEFILYHLSTAMCPKHRADVLENIKKNLENKKIICITTQLIEAGVDISFRCVIRSLAGLDSVMQAAGRCNRNGESSLPKDVYVVSLKDENLDRLYDIKIGKEIAARVIRENVDADLLDKTVMDKFYSYYFFARKGEMDFSTNEGTTIYEMLSDNSVGKENYKNRNNKECPGFILQAFDTAGKAFSVISNNTTNVVVKYKTSIKLIEKLLSLLEHRKNFNTKEILSLIKELGKYSVGLYQWEIDKLMQQGAIIISDDDLGIKILNENFYSDETGVIFDMPLEKCVL